MKVRELRYLLNTVSVLADDDEVIFMDTDSGGELFSLSGLKHEEMSYDEGGNATSTGGTLWLKGGPA